MILSRLIIGSYQEDYLNFTLLKYVALKDKVSIQISFANLSSRNYFQKKLVSTDCKNGFLLQA